MSKQLTPKQKMFCEMYIVNEYNGTKAAIATGYSEKTARTQAARLLSKENIKSYIKELTEISQKQNDKIMSKENVLIALSEIARGNTQNEKAFIDKDGGRHVIKFYDENNRLKALELLGKSYGLFIDRQENKIGLDLPIIEVDEDGNVLEDEVFN